MKLHPDLGASAPMPRKPIDLVRRCQTVTAHRRGSKPPRTHEGGVRAACISIPGCVAHGLKPEVPGASCFACLLGLTSSATVAHTRGPPPPHIGGKWCMDGLFKKGRRGGVQSSDPWPHSGCNRRSAARFSKGTIEIQEAKTRITSGADSECRRSANIGGGGGASSLCRRGGCTRRSKSCPSGRQSPD